MITINKCPNFKTFQIKNLQVRFVRFRKQWQFQTALGWQDCTQYYIRSLLRDVHRENQETIEPGTFRIEVDAHTITAWVRFNDSRWATQVLSLSNRNGSWLVVYRSSYPENVIEARLQHKAITKTFKKLKVIEKQSLVWLQTHSDMV